MDLEAWKIAAQFGIGGVLALVLGVVFWRVGLRLIAAIDRLGERFEAHTKTDVEHHATVRESVVDVNERLAHLQGRIDMALELTPVEQAPPRRPKTSPRGIPVGEYGMRRHRTRDEGDR